MSHIVVSTLFRYVCMYVDEWHIYDFTNDGEHRRRDCFITYSVYSMVCKYLGWGVEKLGGERIMRREEKREAGRGEESGECEERVKKGGGEMEWEMGGELEGTGEKNNKWGCIRRKVAERILLH